MSFQSLLTQRCDIQSQTFTQSAGARKKTYPPVGTNKYTALPCRLQPRSAQFSLRFRRDSMEITHVLYIGSPGGTLVSIVQTPGTATTAPSTAPLVITQAERVVFPSGGSRFFQILGVRNPNEQSKYLVLDLRELKA